jgi:hypothetical protein
VSELKDGLAETIAALAAADPRYKRFGARAHCYELAPPLTPTERDALVARLGALPSDYHDYVSSISAGGAGPYYGLFRAERAADYVVTAPASVSAWQRALPLSHLGCGYFAVLALDGPAIGQVWLDARELALVGMIRPSFTAFVLDWIDRAAHNAWPDAFVPIGRCALQAALTGYLHVCEQRMGLAEGSIGGDDLRAALSDLGTGAIAIAAEGPLFAIGDTVDPCIACARMIENLATQGLDPAAIAPGRPPLPAR